MATTLLWILLLITSFTASLASNDSSVTENPVPGFDFTGQDIVIIQDGEICIKATLDMDIILDETEINPISYLNAGNSTSKYRDIVKMSVKTNQYDGICDGEKYLLNQWVRGPAVAFLWNNTRPKDEKTQVENSVLIKWESNDDIFFIDTIEIHVTVFDHDGHEVIVDKKMDDLLLFPTSYGINVSINSSEVEMGRGTDFFFCRGSFVIGNQGPSSMLITGVSIGVAVTMILGIIFVYKGTRKKPRENILAI